MNYIQSVICTSLLFLAGAAIPEPATRAVPRTFSHNDYVHDRPLLDALRFGFVAVEADIYLAGKDLRVAHDRAKDWTSVPTLDTAYLAPLAELKKKRNNGGVYADATRVLLLVDIKSDGVATYQRLHAMLAEYQAATPGLFTAYTKGAGGKHSVNRGAVDVVISGNRPRELMAGQDVRYAGYDGRMADLAADRAADPGFMPLVSDNWANVFTGSLAWDGVGDIPDATRAKLSGIVADVHARGLKLRFWNLPKDAPTVWGALHDAGVDFINTDDIEGLTKFLAVREQR